MTGAPKQSGRAARAHDAASAARTAGTDHAFGVDLAPDAASAARTAGAAGPAIAEQQPAVAPEPAGPTRASGT
ncbi:hypothetical protein OSI93_10175, partial [Mycobacterium ulcerans]